MKLLEDLIPPSEICDSKIAHSLRVGSLTESSTEVSDKAAFFAVRGSQKDGHEYIPTALRRGARAIVVDRPEAFQAFPRTVLVHSTRKSLGFASSRWFDEPTRSLRLVGVTGTNGKTTSTFLLRHIWDCMGLVSGILGTVEYQIAHKKEPSKLTTPGPLALQQLFHRMVKEGVSHAAIEVSSIALDQERVAGCHFDVGLFTNLTQDHLDYHLDFDDYYRAKKKLFCDYDLPLGIFNIDDNFGERLHEEARVSRALSISLQNTEADFWVDDVLFERDQTCVQAVTPLGKLDFITPLIGKHNLYNSLGVLAVVYCLGQDMSFAARVLSQARGAPGRLERVLSVNGSHPQVFVDYAHSPDALSHVLRSLHELRADCDSRIITVFGCGGDRDKEKRPKMARIVSSMSDITVATSDNPRTEDPESILDAIETGVEKWRTRYYREVNRREAIYRALSLAGPSDIVLIAGKGHETYQIVGTEQFPFDDREVVRDYYRDPSAKASG